ncbi:similar to Saccharomyces cerevisiae YGL163C RAD54 DNA-dependent ATPase, stimulates strand exchange by modifying the topology of double-stranded DNA [Maudiozyma saulgeensis]|uniref:DNA helicase n=1 Tax=Maudiozyma saulgeensis TaxID=1789683 RepID=A0A1X7QZB4_9SACH|nr:similar to Saccharomyces cerevisiae YGL163C RAD54 DNA-dependent ATPase, stimulates strand exchange by modifying the topology of double-stranded DNA [Kazachstania saulgeensis]
MARRRLPDRPPNGIGMAQRPRLVPRPINLDLSMNKLNKPFKVPYRINKINHTTTTTNTNTNTNTNRILRKRSHTVNYSGMDVDENNELIDDLTNPKFLLNKKLTNALSSQRLLDEPSRLDNIEKILKRSFTVPIKGYIQRHSLPLTLGTKKKIITEPRPLHDPSDEFAIVLYDPSVDGQMIIHDPTLTTNTPINLDEKNNKEENNIKTLKHSMVHPQLMSNGLKNKSLLELLGPSESSLDLTTKKFPNVPVVMDPKLTKILRPHQVEGVKFLYRCVTGLAMKDYLDSEKITNALNSQQDTSNDISSIDESISMVDNEIDDSKDKNKKTKSKKKKTKKIEKKEVTPVLPSVNTGAYGCIMADEMGLGKTLQCIALMWTLLRQGPQGKRLIDKCIIVCPSSLVNNWANELVKWLGPGTLSPLAVDGKKSSLVGGGNATVADAVHAWAQAKGRNIVKPVLIISYETLRRNVDQLKGCNVGLMLADEGHRLKNGESLTFTALDSINCPRRIILSGTPIQNDLSEYFALLNFSNPGLLGTRAEFRKNFEIPILRGRDAEASDKEMDKGERQLQTLSNIVSKFIIRRTNDILSKYLPCKYEHVIFVNMKPFQNNLYKQLLRSRDVKKLVKGDGGSQPLKAIGVLKKLCNHPNLLDFEKEFANIPDKDLNIPDNYEPPSSKSRDIQTQYSGKFSILERFLHKIHTESDDKIVLISNYTQTLDLIERMCRYKHYGTVRLDGTMNINKRQKLVDRFNNPENEEFIFLLSSKAGGCGINLIGANRLILMDPDWNPAADQQALARVWRDGQKKDCFIYRFITTGSIEEKIFQRQSMKMSLSSCVVDAKEDVERLFSADNLKQLFQFNEKTICDTHETYHCKRCNSEGKQTIRAPTMLYGDATSWNHINHKGLEKTNDHLLRHEYKYNDISFAFQYISH